MAVRCLGMLIVLVLSVSSAKGQVDRYELGQRLVDFEKAWDRVTDAEARKRTVAPLQQAMRAFFSLNHGKAAEALDRALFELEGGNASDAKRWAASLSIQPEARLIDAKRGEIEVTLKHFYKADGEPSKPSVRLQGVKDVALAIGKTHATVKADVRALPVGDTSFTTEIVIDGKVAMARAIPISRIANLDTRLKAIHKVARSIKKADTIEHATLESLSTLLTKLSDKETLETAYPAARLLEEAEALSAGKPYYTADRPGEFWLTIPHSKDPIHCRLFVPKGLDTKKPVPIVVALHGMGGSENLFFDGYGDGITRKLCEKRGWLMVAPRAGGAILGGPPPVPALLDELAKRYPIDPKRVYLVGHSMGAAHALALAQQSPDRFAGAAMLGGGGTARKPEALAKLPLFIGVGKADFAHGPAKTLAATLEKAKPERLKFKEYEDVEHLMIVREAIEDVFRFWEEQ